MKVFDCSERIFCKNFLFPWKRKFELISLYNPLKSQSLFTTFYSHFPFFLLYICWSEAVKEIATNLSKSPNKIRLQRHSHAAPFSVHSFLEAEFLFGLGSGLCPGTICWKRYLFSIRLLCTFVKNQLTYLCGLICGFPICLWYSLPILTLNTVAIFKTS